MYYFLLAVQHKTIDNYRLSTKKGEYQNELCLDCVSQLSCAPVLDTNKEPQSLLASVNFLQAEKKTLNLEGHASIREAHLESEPK